MNPSESLNPTAPSPGAGDGSRARRTAPVTTLSAAVFVAILAACGSELHIPPAPNVVLIVLDTVGSNHVGTYGYERDTTPNIDGLARDGLVFENAIAQSSWTLPSFGSMMTSRYPSEIFGEMMSNSTPSEPVLTLTEVLADAGYRTLSVTTNPYTSKIFRLMEGFDRSDYETGASATWVIDRAIEALDAAHAEEGEGGAAPFFLYLHFMDTHFPLTVPAPFDSHFPTLDGLPHDRTARYRLEYGDPNLLGTHEFDVYRSHTLALYDGGLRYIDAELGRLVEHLKRSGLYENSVLVVASDHGQEFWDHGTEAMAMGLEHFQRPGVYGLGHGHTLFAELIHVPLIFHGTKVPRGRVERQVRNIDIAPTILGLTGAEDPRFEAQGVDLFAQLGEDDLADLPALSETRSPSAMQWTLRDDGHQYLRLGEREYLFDTASEDLVDLAEENPETLERLRRDFEEMWSSFDHAASGDRVVDEDVQSDLKALGYVQ